MPISEQHKKGLQDLLVNEENRPVLIQLAKATTKNVCRTDNPEVAIFKLTEALGLLITHLPDIYILLSKRAITKEMLFKYLTSRVPDLATNFTKPDLVTKVINYWGQDCTQRSSPFGSKAVVSADAIRTEEDYPIHAIARKFGEWFFERFNANSLRLVDLWTDATLHLTIMASDGINELECMTAAEVLAALTGTKQQFGFHFNPNLTHAGIQGRMDAYGQVVVLCCGTLHTAESSVGVFECAFGLLRDPYSENNWKPKKVKCLLKSKLRPPELHCLCSSETLQEALGLSMPSDDLDLDAVN
ncbi:uncharacterized protein C3orf38 homolog isoform X1 [Drosophila serrata]|uniref:uncharacterized protein C3orf38 homolog isoform X1 n=1 Tax=Drosophila serrata TaxID=7274 RepID=UPI000A1D0187|nr:uncharacterized protein C3orf38 homolog isoform X1 [Drosophila serrata]